MKDYQTYFGLLAPTETEIPASVKKTIDFFERSGLWFKMSRNDEALGCKDAAHKRHRLGHIGIPLNHELKSYFAKIEREEAPFYMVFHSRGHQTLDGTKIRRLIGTNEEIVRISEDELQEIFGMEYGRVNPFILEEQSKNAAILQLFDESLLTQKQAPYTMMTNAGDLTWAVEFYPTKLIEKIANKKVADIVIQQPKYKKQKIGILTGNGPESGVFLWEKINDYVRQGLKHKFRGDFSFPEVTIESIPEMGLSMELEERETESWNAVKRGINLLCESGATIICLACNTTQYFKDKIKEICAPYQTELIDIPSVLEAYLDEKQIGKFAFLGIKYVANIRGKYSAFGNLKKYEVEQLSEKSIKKIHKLGFHVKEKGVNAANINKLRDLINNETRADTVVIALTEISIILDTQKKSKSKTKFIDTLQVLAKAVANRYIELACLN